MANEIKRGPLVAQLTKLGFTRLAGRGEVVYTRADELDPDLVIWVRTSIREREEAGDGPVAVEAFHSWVVPGEEVPRRESIYRATILLRSIHGCNGAIEDRIAYAQKALRNYRVAMGRTAVGAS